MTVEEFSNEFDALLNSYSAVPPYGDNNRLDITLDEYEKSVFLTKAQEDLIISVYSGKNTFNDLFERSEEIRRYLNELVKTVISNIKVDETGVSDKSVFFKIPDDVWFITYESAILKDDSLGCHNGITALVTPITQDEYYKISKNPFRGPSNKRVLRLDIHNSIVELISQYNISDYLIRYLSKPEPIILTDLKELSINGIKDKTECKLNPVVHRAILERAVRLAILSRVQISGNK